VPSGISISFPVDLPLSSNSCALAAADSGKVVGSLTFNNFEPNHENKSLALLIYSSGVLA